MFLLFRNYLPLEKGMALYLNELECPSTQGCFVPSLVEIGPLVPEKKVFKILSMYLSMYFRFFVIICPWKRAWSFIWTLNSLHPSSFIEIGTVVLENVKSVQKEDRWSEKLTWAFSSGELKIKLFYMTLTKHVLEGSWKTLFRFLEISNSMEQYRILYWHVRVIFKHTRIYQRTVASELSDECKKRTWTKYKLFMLHSIYLS